MDKFLLTKPGFMPIELGGILIDSYVKVVTATYNKEKALS